MSTITDKDFVWLNRILTKYGNKDSVLDVSELDGMLTAIITGPTILSPNEWMPAIWGGKEHTPDWQSDAELKRFITLILELGNIIEETLIDYPDQFEPMFNYREDQEKEYLIVEEWCFGFIRGAALQDWSGLPSERQADFDAIALHGREENFPLLSEMNEEQLLESIHAIQPAIVKLHQFYQPQRVIAHQEALNVPVVVAEKIGRNDPCPCGSGKKYKQCCLSK